MKTFAGRVAVVTGGASGIGLALAQRFAAERMKVVVADVDEGALEQCVRELRAAGSEVLGVRCDVAKAEEVEALAERSVAHFGAVHVLCNNAGVGTGGALVETSLSEWEWVLGVNLWGVVHGIRAFVPRMIAQNDEGHVVNTASVAGLVSPPFTGIYAVTKHAVVTMTEVLHKELAMLGHKVKASVLCPGWVRTNILDSARNQPAAVREAMKPPTEQGQLMQAATRVLVEQGQAPEKIAAEVLDAIREERFYVLTHPEFTSHVEERMRDIIEGKNPKIFPM